MPRRNLRLLRTALTLYVIAILFLTLGKTWFTIGGLWRTGAHENRSLHLIPFADFVTATTWFAPTVNLVGNLSLFFPFGLLLALMYFRQHIVRDVALMGFGFSLSVEALQYLFQIGYSDTGDLIANTAGAAMGAQLAVILVRRASRYLQQVAIYGCMALTALLFIKLDVVPILLQVLPNSADTGRKSIAATSGTFWQ
ncbi:VanZ family protein [Corynebacterium sp.]|uniref:VanZ family protein n=1 Tax=Corynebacterium sp. TaxID=1720 RepID=UPI0026DDA2EA|nr:VanZ family protein [Corynebacterium sp.]MDO5077596.1 VanZ family protein [Corynebacterium sp.]